MMDFLRREPAYRLDNDGDVDGHNLLRRQPILVIPTTYGGLNAGPSPAVVAGIVLGAVAGFLLIFGLLFATFSLGGGRFPVFRRTVETEEETIEISRRRPFREPGRRRPFGRPPRRDHIHEEEIGSEAEVRAKCCRPFC